MEWTGDIKFGKAGEFAGAVGGSAKVRDKEISLVTSRFCVEDPNPHADIA